MQRFGPYRVGETIGRGSMATVKVAVHEVTNRQVALKVIPRKHIEAQAAKERQQQHQAGKATSPAPGAGGAGTGDGTGVLPVNTVAAKIALEIRVLRLLKHPHVIRLYDVVFTPTDVVLVLEYAAGGELFDYLNDFGRLAEAQARTLFQQLLSALEYCHANRVAHRDLKPENIILDKGTSSLKLTDFDLAGRIVDGQLFDVSCGTPNYAAPEVVSGQLYSGPEADVWSAGVVLYAMLTGRLPFDDENVQMLFRKIRAGEFTIPACVSAHARDLLARLLVVDPLQRITVQQALAHPWVTASIPRYLVDIHDACVQRVTGLARTGPDSDGIRHDLIAAFAAARAAGPGGVTRAIVPVATGYTGASPDGGVSPVPAEVIRAVQQQQQEQQQRSGGAAGGLARATSAEELVADDEDDAFVSQQRTGASPTPGADGAAPIAAEDGSVALLRGADHAAPGTGGIATVGLLLDQRLAAEVAALFKLSIAEVEAAIQHATMRREQDARDQLHRLVHGVPPRRPLVFARPPPAIDKTAAAREHDALVAYAILKHAKRAAHATRHRDPAASASLGGGLASSLRPDGAASSVEDRSRAVALASHAHTADIAGQGALGGLRPCHVGPRAVVPPPGELVTSSFNGASYSMSGMQPRALSGLRGLSASAASPNAAAALAQSPAAAAAPGGIAASYGSVASSQSTRSASGAVVVRQPAALYEPAALRVAAVARDAYNGISRRPGPVRLGRPADTAAADAVASPLLSRAGSSAYPTAAQREVHEQRAELATLLDKAPQLGPGADAAAEAWAQTYRVGLMAEGKSATATFLQVFAVLKAQGMVWKVVRPFNVCAVDHVTRCKLHLQLTRCASNTPCKWLLDVRLAPVCPASALPRAAEVLEALALEFSGPPVIPRTNAQLAAADQQPAPADGTSSSAQASTTA